MTVEQLRSPIAVHTSVTWYSLGLWLLLLYKLHLEKLWGWCVVGLQECHYESPG